MKKIFTNIWNFVLLIGAIISLVYYMFLASWKMKKLNKVEKALDKFKPFDSEKEELKKEKEVENLSEEEITNKLNNL